MDFPIVKWIVLTLIYVLMFCYCILNVYVAISYIICVYVYTV